jgi:HemY protein
MLSRLIWLVVFLILAAASANWLMGQPGQMQLEWLDWRIEIRTSLAVFLLVVLCVLLVFADRLWRRLVTLPGWLGRNMKQRRGAAGHKALTLGLMAVSAGEAGEARRQATRAQRLLDVPQLTDLLSAQAAHLAGDLRAAERYFRSLTQAQDTAFLGHIGLARLAHEKNSPDEALRAARQALSLKPKSAMAAAQVLHLEAARGNWSAAAPALEVMIAAKDHADPENDTPHARRRQKVALAYLQARPFFDGDHEEQTLGRISEKEAARQLRLALATDPGFWPATVLLADYHLQSGQGRKAAKALETGFCAVPHALLSDRLKQAWNVNEGAFVAKLIKLAGNASHAHAAEAETLAAEAALAAGLEGEARRLLDGIVEVKRDVMTLQLIARLAEIGGDSSAAATALRAAGGAMRPRGWQCQTCHVMSAEWHSHCQSCDGFATLEWQRPDHLTPLGPVNDRAADNLPQRAATDD